MIAACRLTCQKVLPQQCHLAIVAVGQEHDQAGLPQPLGLSTGDELVKHHLHDRLLQSDRLRWWLCSELSAGKSLSPRVCCMGCAT